MIEFILERYNYWIFILLMMTGLYTVISRGNLVKKIIGLNLFQTSVFIFYISIGKILGGTAPILMGDYGGGHGDAHGAGDGPGHDKGHDKGYDKGHGGGGEDGHAENTANHSNANHADSEKGADGGAGESAQGGDHGAEANSAAAGAPADADAAQADAPYTNVLHDDASAGDAAYAVNEAAHAAGEIIYTNPLPHVLILTAIVVGVATTAVGLALAVRIREAYGTIEEDELEADDAIAEYGVDLTAPPAGGAS